MEIQTWLVAVQWVLLAVSYLAGSRERIHRACTLESTGEDERLHRKWEKRWCRFKEALFIGMLICVMGIAIHAIMKIFG